MLDVLRKELKYITTEVEADALARRMGQLLKADPNNHGTGYVVRSLYFDTLSDRDFEEKADGMYRRRKIRLRSYGRGTLTKLELKEKIGSDQRKRSLLLQEEEGRRFIEGDYGFLKERCEPLAKELCYYMTKHVYRPRVIVEYDREAYYHDLNDIRITFDKHLRATEASFDLFDEHLMLYPVAPREEVTMEVKYNRFLLTYIKDVLSLIDKQPISNSKYMRSRTVSKHGRV